MEQANKYNVYIGLLKSDMKTELNTQKVFNSVNKEFIKIGIIGFNSDIKPYCFWNGNPEPALKISFINSFSVYEKDILKALNIIKNELEQESVLVEKEPVLYNFV
jgi:hypothetical protein